MTNRTNITADALALQERDDFRATGWLKVIAPAKVNLHLAIGARREDGYHEAVSIMHALSLHDVVYMRWAVPGSASPTEPNGAPADFPVVRMVATGDVEVPAIASSDNLAARAVVALAQATGRPPADRALEIRIEKNIPAQGGLGGGSTDAAAALLGAARLWGLDSADAAIERVARTLGADVAFFLHGGCAALTGAGDVFERVLTPSKCSVALVKPEGGVSTAAAYRAFDEAPAFAPADIAANAATAQRADDVRLFNNLAAAAESLMPELASVRAWVGEQPGVRNALLCGSGATTFALCDTTADALRIVAAARKRGWWARATSFSPIRCAAVAAEGACA